MTQLSSHPLSVEPGAAGTEEMFDVGQQSSPQNRNYIQAFGDRLSNPSTSPLRVAWLLPMLARSFYFQPVFREFAQIFPQTTIFTGFWPGYLDGYENAFRVEQVSGVGLRNARPDAIGHMRGWIWAPPSIIPRLFSYRPDLVIVGGFNLWTFYAALLKRMLKFRMTLLWDGNSQGSMLTDDWKRVRLRRLLSSYIDSCITNSELGSGYLEEIGIPAHRILHAPYQVPAVEVLSMRYADPGALNSLPRPLFLSVGRLMMAKGINYLLDACATLRQRGLEQFSLVLVGEGADAPVLKQRAHQLGLDKHVLWTGPCRYEELGAFYAACDVFIFPTLDDCRGMVVPEAMAFGKAIIRSRYADLGDVVKDGENGYVCDPTNPVALADCMAQFIINPQSIASCGKRSLELIADHNPPQAARNISNAIALALR